MATDRGANGAGFVHHASWYDSDEAFLAMALPFAEEGLEAGSRCSPRPRPATSNCSATPSARGPTLDTAETAYFGRRPVERVSSSLRYVNRREVPGRRIRTIAEPLWAGRSARQIAEWKRMESGLNVLLADADLWMICPYDTRTVPEDVAAAARATHPGHVAGAEILPCAGTSIRTCTRRRRTPAAPAAPGRGPAGRAGHARRRTRLRARQCRGGRPRGGRAWRWPRSSPTKRRPACSATGRQVRRCVPGRSPASSPGICSPPDRRSRFRRPGRGSRRPVCGPGRSTGCGRCAVSASRWRSAGGHRAAAAVAVLRKEQRRAHLSGAAHRPAHRSSAAPGLPPAGPPAALSRPSGAVPPTGARPSR